MTFTLRDIPCPCTNRARGVGQTLRPGTPTHRQEPGATISPLIAYRRAQEHLAADPDTTHPETRQAWQEALESYYDRTLHTARTIGHQVTYRYEGEKLKDERLGLTCPDPPHARTFPHDWLKAFYLSLILRDHRRACILSDIDAGVIAHVNREGTPSASVRSRHWIEALQAYYLDGLPFLVCLNLARDMTETDDFLDQQDTGGMLLPTMETLDAIDDYNPDRFEKFLPQALTCFRTGPKNPSWEHYPLALLALACCAHETTLEDPEFDWHITSDLLPQNIVHNTWTNHTDIEKQGTDSTLIYTYRWNSQKDLATFYPHGSGA